MLMIKREMRYIQEGYGAQSKEDGLVLDVIQKYAQKWELALKMHTQVHLVIIFDCGKAYT